jgi:hypothetical protein
MAADNTGIPTPSPDLLRFLKTTQGVVGNTFLPSNYRQLLTALVTLDELKAVERNPNDPLWWFLPPILYDLFDEKLEFDWLDLDRVRARSIVVVSPPFVSVTDQLRGELGDLGIASAPSKRLFSRRFVGLLYGGYPWFEAYLRICDARGICGEECVVLSVTSEDVDVPSTLEVFKKRRRNAYGQPLQMAFDDLPYPGVVRPFHAPARIETTRHIRAVELA